MTFSPPRFSRRSIAMAAVLVGMVSLAIGAHAALNKRALDAAKAIATEQGDTVKRPSRRSEAVSARASLIGCAKGALASG